MKQIKGFGEWLNEGVHRPRSRRFKIGLKTEDVFDLIQYHDSYRDLYPDYSNENESEEDYYFPTEQDAYNDVNETLDFFSRLPNPIPIWRSIKVESVDDIDFDYLGDSWSFDKESAISFAKNQAGGNFLLSGLTNFSNVDWVETVRLWYLFSGTDDGYEENEIRIIDSDKIFDVKTESIK